MSNATGLPDRKPEKKQAPRKNTASDKLREMPASAAKEAPREVPKKAESTGTEKSSMALRPGGEVADLYIVHGWTYTVEPWAETLEILRKNGVKVKMLNVPGLTAESDKVFDIDDYVKWADEAIPDGAVALGHSNGGRILLNLCKEKPGKLKYLILLDSAGIYETTLKKKVVGLIAKLGRPLKKIPVVDKVFHRLTGTTDYSKAPENMKKTLVNMLESDRTLDLKKVTTKTFILWGKKDTTTPPRQATKMYEELPNADLKFYANWTHAPYIADPEGLARAILTLVKRVNK